MQPVTPPQPAQLPLPIVLSAAPSNGQASGSTAGNTGVAANVTQPSSSIDIRDYPLIFSGPTNVSPACFSYRFTLSIAKRIPGGGMKSRLQVFALGTLLRLGLEKAEGGSGRYKMVPVSAAATNQLLLQLLPEHKGGAALVQCYQQQYGSDILAVATDPACSQYVRLLTIKGQQHMLLLLDKVAAPSQTQPQPSPRPPPLNVTGAASRVQAVHPVGTSTSAQALTHQLAGLQLGNGNIGACVGGSSSNVGSSLPPGQLVTTEAQAAAAVAELLSAPEVAMVCEGDLQRDGAIALVQLYAPGTAGGACYVFDLHGMAPGVRAAAVRHLARLMESPDTAKVLHDCRSDCEAFFYLHGIRLANVWDTQVAFGLLQFLSSVGASSDAVNAPIGLNQLLQQYELPPNPLKKVMHGRMDREPDLFERRPMEAEVMQYAVADVWQLLPAKALLEADLGPAAALRVEPLSAAYSEWGLEAGDRRCGAAAPDGGSGGSYAGALRLPLGRDMQLSISPPDYRPRYSPALLGAEAEGGTEYEPAPQPAPPQLSAAEDADTQLVLELFPEQVRAAIQAALATEELSQAAAAASQDQEQGQEQASTSTGALGSSGSSGRAGPVQLVEVIVDVGRPVRIRLSSRREIKLEQELSVEDALEHLAAAKGRLHLTGGRHGDLFYSDNRAGIPGTLHRISAMRDREAGIIGLTYRVGRHAPGVGRLILDVLHALAEGHDATGHEVQGAFGCHPPCCSWAPPAPVRPPCCVTWPTCCPTHSAARL